MKLMSFFLRTKFYILATLVFIMIADSALSKSSTEFFISAAVTELASGVNASFFILFVVSTSLFASVFLLSLYFRMSKRDYGALPLILYQLSPQRNKSSQQHHSRDFLSSPASTSSGKSANLQLSLPLDDRFNDNLSDRPPHLKPSLKKAARAAARSRSVSTHSPDQPLHNHHHHTSNAKFPHSLQPGIPIAITSNGNSSLSPQNHLSHEEKELGFLRQLGWQQPDEDQNDYVITEQEMNEFLKRRPSAQRTHAPSSSFALASHDTDSMNHPTTSNSSGQH
jgi:hypothetical protein